MSTKNYEAIANICAGELSIYRNDPARRQAIINYTLSLSDYFKRDNPRFKRRDFLIACGFTAADAPFTFASTDS